MLVNDAPPYLSNGTYLGLDLSKTSTGIAVFNSGTVSTEAVGLHTDIDSSPYGLAMLRRELYSVLKEKLAGQQFDTVVVEDIFIGANVKSYRILAAINTVPDDLILDGVFGCKNLVRVNNRIWKHHLVKGEGIRGFNDKQRVNEALAHRGIVISGKGSQDQLDAIGMVIGWYYSLYEKDTTTKKGGDKYTLRDLQVQYKSNLEDIVYTSSTNRHVLEDTGVQEEGFDYLKSRPGGTFDLGDFVPQDSGLTGGEEYSSQVASTSNPIEAEIGSTLGPIDGLHRVVLDLNRVTEDSLLSAVESQPYSVFITKRRVNLGVLAQKLQVEPLPFGGYVQWCLK